MSAHPVSLTASLRRLLERICPTDDELTAFCIDYFAEEVGRELSPAMSRTEKLNLLLTRVDSARVLAALRSTERFFQHAQLVQEATEPAECPFPGLEFFTEEQAGLFAGREAEVKEALAMLGQSAGRHCRWLQLEGPSGNGKSSLARAGLLPAIRQHGLDGGPAKLRVAVLRPGREPIRNLTLALSQALELPLRSVESLLDEGAQGLRALLRQHLPAGLGLLLLLDQMEELFTVSEAGTPGRCDALITAVLDDADLPFYLITTIRSDFLASFHQLPGLELHLNRTARYYLRSLRAEQLRDALVQMASRAGVAWEDGLLDRLLAEAALQEGSLPLIAHVLWVLWHSRSKGLLTQEGYDQLGGVAGALSQSADNLLRGLSAAAQRRAECLLLSLIRIGRGGPDVKVAVPRPEALRAAGGDAEAERLLAQLSGGRNPDAPAAAMAPPRLLLVGGLQADPALHRVELVHNALLLHWETLKRWVEENRKALERRDDVESAAQVWEAAGHPDDGLPGGNLLAYYEGRGLPVSQRERLTALASGRADRFLSAARAQEALRQRLRHPLRRWRWSALAVLAVSALGATAWWWTFKRVQVHYYSAFVTRWGVQQGVFELNEKQRRHMWISYRFRSQRGRLLTVERVNSHGQLRNTDGDIAQWEYSYWDNGNVQEMTARSQAGQVKRRDIYSADLRRREVRDAFHNPAPQDGKDVSVYLLEYDARGFLQKEQFANIYGAPRPDANNVFGYVYARNELGQLTRGQPLGIKGEPVPRRDGVAAILNQYDRWGNTSQRTYFDANGQRTLDSEDHSSGWKQVSDEQGNITELTYIDINDKPTLNKQGYSTIRYIYDEYGNESEDSYWGADGKRIRSSSDEVAGTKTDYDERGNAVRYSYFDISKLPTISKAQIASYTVKYDSRDNAIELSYYDIFGQRALNDDGYSIYRKKYDEQGNKIEVEFFDVKDKPTLQTSGYSSYKAKYDERGNQVEVRYFDTSGHLIFIKEGYAICRKKYNERGKESEESYFGIDEKPALINAGYASRVYIYDESGNRSKTAFFGLRGEPVLNKDGIFSIVYRYDERGNEIQGFYLGIGEKPVLTIPEGIHGYQQKYDDRGNLVENTYIGIDEKPVYCAHGNVTKLYKHDNRGNKIFRLFLGIDGAPQYQSEGDVGSSVRFDDHNRILESTHLDANLKPTLCKKGHAAHQFKYDERGNNIEAILTDVQNKPVSDKSGISIIRKKFDERSNNIETAFFDSFEKPVINADLGISRSTHKFDARNNIVEDAYFGIDGKSKESKDGYALRLTKYDDRRNPILIEYFGASGQPTLNKNGYSAIHQEYDPLGRVIVEAYIGLDGKPILSQEGSARITRSYDALGNILSESSFGSDGQPRLNKKGYASVRFTYDEHHRKVETTYLGVDGKPTLNDEGVATERSQYDERGLLSRESYFDPSGRLSLRKGGYASVTTQRDARGQEQRQTLLGIDGLPRVGNEGYAVRTSRYDALGNLLERSFFGIDNRPILTESNGAGFIAAYDLPDREIRKTVYDLRKVPTRGTGAGMRWQLAGGRLSAVEEGGAASSARDAQAALQVRAGAYLASYQVERLRDSHPELFQDARGLLVVAASASALAKGGLLPGDVLLLLDGQRLSATAELVLGSKGDPQQPVKLALIRDGRRMELQVPRSQLAVATEPQ